MTDEGQGVAGIGLFLAAFVDERGADKALESIKQAKDRGDFHFDEGAVVRRNELGKVTWKETGDMGLGKGAAVGAFIGGIVGLLAGPTGAIAGAAAGAVVGGVAAAHDSGFDQASLREISGVLPPGTSALVVTTSREVAEAVRREVDRQERLTLAKDIAAEVSEHLEADQDVLLAMVVTEASIAATKVVSSPTELAVFGIAGTEAGVVARAGLVTPEGAAAVEAVATPEGDTDSTEDADTLAAGQQDTEEKAD